MKVKDRVHAKKQFGVGPGRSHICIRKGDEVEVLGCSRVGSREYIIVALNDGGTFGWTSASNFEAVENAQIGH